jgi:hypothetical protein
MIIFDIAAGSVAGREHVRTGRNNQDALHVRANEHGVAAVVTDGCGSSGHSEVGSWLGARCVVEAALEALAQGARPEEPSFLDRVRSEVLRYVAEVSGRLGPDALAEAMLFTVVGAVITPEHTLIFAAGDGVWALNGKVHKLGPFPGNAPPYLTYGLLRPGMSPLERQALVPTPEVESLLLGTDGAQDLLELESTPMPESGEPVGPFSQLWEEDRFFRQPDALRRWLTLLTREHVRADFDARRLVRTPGLLGDDTTLLVLRRTLTPAAQEGEEENTPPFQTLED